MRNKLTTTLLMTAALIGFLAAWGFQSGAAAETGDQVDDAVFQAPAFEAPAIQDAVILKGWELLRGMKEPIQAANGVVVSGESLAQFLLESQIPVVWGSDEICGGSSCSRMYCASDGACSYEDGQSGIDPIYINPSVPTQSVGMMERLAGELAHEAYHRMRPFGNGMITQIEEYWAFYINTQIFGADYPKFDGVDPLDPDQLQSWFYYNSLHGYLKLAPYPGSAAQSPQVSQPSASQSLEAGIVR